MKIIIWGVPCVGKTETAKKLSKMLNYKLFDINEILKKKYGTIDNFLENKSNYETSIIKRDIALDIINNNDNFVMTMTLIEHESIVDEIINTDAISVELIDSVKSIYDKIRFYDENDNLIPDSIEYRDKHKNYYMRQIKNDMTASKMEYKDIPKYDLKERKLNDYIDDFATYIVDLENKRRKIWNTIN